MTKAATTTKTETTEEKVLVDIKKETTPAEEAVVTAPAPTPEVTPTTEAPAPIQKPVLPSKTVPVIPLQPKTNLQAPRMNGGPKRPLNNNQMQNSNNSYAQAPEREGETALITGVLDTSKDGHGVVRVSMSGDDENDAYISTSQIRRFRLRPGDVISGPARIPKENERYWGMLKVDTVNGIPAEEAMRFERVKFKSLTPVYPDTQIVLETGDEPLSLRIIDMIAPIGKGQRSLIVSPPKAGKTTLLKDIATGVARNHPEIHVMAVLVGERPEEVTDIRRHIDRITNGKGEVAASNFDESADDQCRVAELALEKAKRMVEIGKDVIILLDSITRLARAYNLSIPTSGRTLSGGFDPAALFPPKKFFGAARNFEIQGSLTIIGTALVDTGSRMDDLVYEEFKGTGNQEVHLDRKLAERRVYPAIDVQRSGTRRDDLLIDGVTYQSIATLHRMLDMLDREERTTTLIEQMKKSKSNKDFLNSLKVS
ncbi:transcription termination factor Rho [Candidatus Woesebacteria bacterium]|nr:transcription termination factor Rho [Candidatus Woesebacteria bacterium]